MFYRQLGCDHGAGGQAWAGRGVIWVLGALAQPDAVGVYLGPCLLNPVFHTARGLCLGG